MKTKKVVALTMSVALALGAASMIAACNNNEGDKPGGGSYVEDTTVYHCAGTSAGPDGNLYEQGWNEKAAGATDKVTFVKDTTVTDKNVYTLEMKLYAGDMFKIVHDESWTGEITTYYFTNAEEDSTYNYVAKTDGEIIFRDESGTSSNITLTEGHDGIYKFTLVTNPSATDAKEKYQLSYELVESIGRLQIPYKMAVMGDVNNFNALNPLAMTNSNGVWSILVEITEDELNFDAEGNQAEEGEGTHSAIYVINTGDGTGEANEKMEFVDETLGAVEVTAFGTDYTVNLLTEGKWAITFNQETKTVTISEVAYELYFIGSFCGWAAENGYSAYPLTANADGTVWSGTLTITEDAQVQLYNAKGATDADKYIPGNNYNLTAGSYFFKYNTETGNVEYEKYNYYVVGTFIDSENNAHNFEIVKDLTPVMEATDTLNVYKVTMDIVDVTAHSQYSSWLPDSGIFAIQVVYGTSLNGVKDWNINGGNQYFDAAGTYEITIDVSESGTPATWTLVTD